MKETIYTIPVSEGFEAEDECPFCFMERQAEQSAIRYVAGPGASYMEPDVRAVTNRTGFCPAHTKKLYDYGNTLGNALMLQTYMDTILEELHQEVQNLTIPPKRGLFASKKPAADPDPYWKRLQEHVNSCYLCEKIEYNMDRYFQTFFMMIKDAPFRSKVETCKGFCLKHFAQLLEQAQIQLPNSQREWFCQTLYPLMEKNLVRVKADLDWLIAKYDYRNASKPWGTSQDALPRTMQKLEGIYPADKPYKND